MKMSKERNERQETHPASAVASVALLPEEFDLDRADVEMVPKRWVSLLRSGEAVPGHAALAPLAMFGKT